jgi:hypothetical protein
MAVTTTTAARPKRRVSAKSLANSILVRILPHWLDYRASRTAASSDGDEAMMDGTYSAVGLVRGLQLSAFLWCAIAMLAYAPR